MTIRVHELAKEFRISTAALKKHLHDMGVTVKSHMSPVDDEIVAKIRNKFKEETEAIKQRERDRKRYHKRIEQSHQKTDLIKRIQPKLEQAKRDAEKRKKEGVKTFVEKPIKKAPASTSRTATSQTGQRTTAKPNQTRSEQSSKPTRTSSAHHTSHTTSRSQPKRSGYTPRPPRTAPPTRPSRQGKKDDDKIPLTAVLAAQKEAAAKKKVVPDDKKKHLKAKVRHLKKGGRKKKFTPTEEEQAEITKNIRKTMATKTKRKKYKKEDKQFVREDAKISISEFTSVSELAKMMDVNPTEIITKFFMMGQMVTINQRLDKDSLEMICSEFEFDVEFHDEYGSDMLQDAADQELSEANLTPRPPIVTVMGHVDHGKTSILDRIRSSNIIAGESGGITQHIGAYQVLYNDAKITFLDTPGHEAFAAMRARGANVTDIAVIVVAANEGVKKQTIEAIDHARAANVTIIIAINKIDLKDANIDHTINDLMKQGVYLEGYGGDIQWIPCSARTGEGIEDLLDAIVLSSEVLELKAAADIHGKGIVIEARLDPRMGTVATILLQQGSIVKGDSVVCGATYGRVRKMEDERGKEISKLNPSDVAIIYGLNEVPKAGDILNKVENEKDARQISAERMHIRKEREKYQTKTNLDNLFQKIKDQELAEIKMIVKGDTDGSVEALCDSFQKLSNEEVQVSIIHKGVGGITEADVNMASASDAFIIGFHVRPSSASRKLAEDEGVELKIYHIIYEAIEDLQKAMVGMLAPELKEVFVGSAEVRQAFRIKKLGTIAGCFVDKGSIKSDCKIRLFRNNILVHDGTISSLKHFSQDVKEVKAGSECGIGIENFNDIKDGDSIECYRIEEVSRTVI